ncbi:MAG: hypothetical protein JXQ90_08565 [Cyclobacteriaceae bacterium]
MESEKSMEELKDQVSRGLKEAYRKMADFKKRNNSPMIVSRDGKIVSIPPEEIPPTTSAKNE